MALLQSARGLDCVYFTGLAIDLWYIFPSETSKTRRSSGPCGPGGREACSPAWIYYKAHFWPGPIQKLTVFHTIQKVGCIPILKYKICWLWSAKAYRVLVLPSEWRERHDAITCSLLCRGCPSMSQTTPPKLHWWGEHLTLNWGNWLNSKVLEFLEASSPTLETGHINPIL